MGKLASTRAVPRTASDEDDNSSDSSDVEIPSMDDLRSVDFVLSLGTSVLCDFSMPTLIYHRGDFDDEEYDNVKENAKENELLSVSVEKEKFVSQAFLRLSLQTFKVIYMFHFRNSSFLMLSLFIIFEHSVTEKA